jgi:endogenous inhibitor of DNA gyrase (YacG/DUF329 family)
MSSGQNPEIQATVGGRCPICGKLSEHAHRPFCSRRCADIDLAHWLGGGYVIAGGSRDADEDGDDTAAGATPPKARELDPEDEN